MNWQDFMYMAIGVAVLVLAGMISLTLYKVWPILDRLDEVSDRVEKTSRILKSPAKFIEATLNGVLKKGGG